MKVRSIVKLEAKCDGAHEVLATGSAVNIAVAYHGSEFFYQGKKIGNHG